jgi:hypothetical protein
MPKKRKRNRGDYIRLHQHRRVGNILVPPFLEIPNVKPISWRDQRLPELLWAALLTVQLQRDHVINVFREVASYIAKKTDLSKFLDVTHTGMTRLPINELNGLLSILTSSEEQRQALSGLLFFKTLPARDLWVESLNDVEPNVQILMKAVAATLDDQSQESTDCRWMCLLIQAAANRFTLPIESEEMAKELESYPYYGDMRKVRPTIRAAEGALSMMLHETPASWPEEFWKECWLRSPCFALGVSGESTLPNAGTNLTRIDEVHHLLIQHFFKTNTTTAVDAPHDATFGVAFYSLSILRELLRTGNAQSIVGRSALRTMLECFVTLAYLAKENKADLWKSFRVFGAGQAKLAFLKLDEDPSRPFSMDLDVLRALANEDTWEEFVPINLGHWEKSNLRRLSEVAQVKNEYDRFYPWTSAYSHGHWGPVRETTFTICGNPLHRVHRIPRKATKALPDVIEDACLLVDKVLEIVSRLYPEFRGRVTIEY